MDTPTPSSPAFPPSGASAAGAWAAPHPTEIEALLPGYEILELVGRGGMGAVYKARQLSLDRIVAIKILPPDLWDNEVDYAERFRQEARVMAKMMHPGMIAVFDFGAASDGKLYFVMEYVEGTDVARMLAEQGSLPSHHALAITAHVCDTLRYAHEKGIIHRDIKPANVMVDVDGNVKVADFGLAKLMAQDLGLTRSTVTMGTPDFVAPEALIMGAAVDGRADLYSLGVMLYQMLTGKLPRGVFTMPSQLVPGLDPRFDDIVLRAMQAEPEARFTSAAEFRQALDHILNVPEYRQPQAPEPAPKSGGKGWALGGALLGCLALAAAGGVWYTKGRPAPSASLAPSPSLASPSRASSASSQDKGETPSTAPASASVISSPPSAPGKDVAGPTPITPVKSKDGAETAPASPQLTVAATSSPNPAGTPPAMPSPAPEPPPPSPPAAPPSTAPQPPLDPVVDQKLKDWEAQYLAAVDRDVEAKHRDSVSTLDARYLEAINRTLPAIHDQKEGDALLKEKERVTNHGALPPSDEAGTPDSLKKLRATYRTEMAKYDVERSKGDWDLRLKYHDMLSGYELDLTKAGNGAGAAEVAEKLKTLSMADPGANAPLAQVEAPEAMWGTLRKDETLYSDSPRYFWAEIPQFFKDFRFSKQPNKISPTLHFKVVSDGVVFMACTSRWQQLRLKTTDKNTPAEHLTTRAELEEAGWKPLGSNLKSNESFAWLVYYRNCKTGEQFSYRTEKYCTPKLLIK